MNCGFDLVSDDQTTAVYRCIRCGKPVSVPSGTMSRLIRRQCKQVVFAMNCLFEFETTRDDRDWYRCRTCDAVIETAIDTNPPRRECQFEKCPPCECPEAGWCARHKQQKTEMTHRLCQNDAEQRATWDYITVTGRSPHGVQPSAARRVMNFGLAAIRHFFSGQGTRTDDEIERILEICNACPSGLFNGSYCESLKCGCFLNKKKHFSKIAWASEHCPEAHW